MVGGLPMEKRDEALIAQLVKENETNFNAIGLLNWSPMYYPVQNIY